MRDSVSKEKKKVKDKQDDSAGKDTCHQVGQPEFNPLYNNGRRKIVPYKCICAHTSVHTMNEIPLRK